MERGEATPEGSEARCYEGLEGPSLEYQSLYHQPSPAQANLYSPTFSLDSAVEFSLINSPNLRSIFIRRRGGVKLETGRLFNGPINAAMLAAKITYPLTRRNTIFYYSSIITIIDESAQLTCNRGI